MFLACWLWQGIFRCDDFKKVLRAALCTDSQVCNIQFWGVDAGSAFGGGGRELANWEVIALGGLAGALASVATTPADVMKTRIMTAAAAESVNAGALLVSHHTA